MPNFIGFQYRGILDLYGILFHAVVVFGPEHYFLLKSAETYCKQEPSACHLIYDNQYYNWSVFDREVLSVSVIEKNWFLFCPIFFKLNHTL